MLEERVGSLVTARNVWSLAYIDALVLRDAPDAASPAGAPDPAFSGDGKATADFGGAGDIGYAVAVQPWDGKVVIAGRAGPNGSGDFAVLRLNPDGTPDPTFSGDGKPGADFGADDSAAGVAVPPDGRTLVAGTTDNNSHASDIALLRLNADGTPDASFDGDGKRVRDFYGGGEVVRDPAVPGDGSGRSVVAGNRYAMFMAARFDADGTADGTFDGDGLALVEFRDSADGSSGAVTAASGRSPAVQADGKAVPARYTAHGSPDRDFALLRLARGFFSLWTS